MKSMVILTVMDLMTWQLGYHVKMSALVDAGAVNVLYGSSNGLSATSPRPDQIWPQDSIDVNNVSEEFDGFGRALG